MEGDLSSRNLMQGNPSYGGFNSQVPMRVHHHHHQQQQQHNPHLKQGSSSSSMGYPTIHETFPLPVIGTIQEDQTVSLSDYNKPDRNKSPSDDDEPSFTEDPIKGKKSSSSSPWQRVKWTDTMVRLLITAVSYISEETSSAEYLGGSKRKCQNLQKKGKWKSISKVMAERGHFVSPQQCEDKFNDLNKRYKRLNEILGRGTSCEVVENPALLEVMDHISSKAKDEVRKILSSKHLHYEEMCSYHNGNRLHLPPDPDLQHSLRLALRSRDNHDDADVKRQPNEENDEVDQEDEVDDHDEYGNSAKKAKQCQGHEDFSYRNSLNSYKPCNFPAETADIGAENVTYEGTKTNTMVLQKQSANCWKLQIEEQRVHIEEQMLELERERFKWQRFCQKKDGELEVMRIEIERMKLENERMALELRRKEMGIIDNN